MIKKSIWGVYIYQQTGRVPMYHDWQIDIIKVQSKAFFNSKIWWWARALDMKVIWEHVLIEVAGTWWRWHQQQTSGRGGRRTGGSSQVKDLALDMVATHIVVGRSGHIDYDFVYTCTYLSIDTVINSSVCINLWGQGQCTCSAKKMVA